MNLFRLATDVDAVVYLMLVNDLIHGLFPDAMAVGEDVSGMPAFGIRVGFDYRLHMAVADKWIDILIAKRKHGNSYMRNQKRKYKMASDKINETAELVKGSLGDLVSKAQAEAP